MDDFERFYNSALRFLSYRPRSEKEVREKLNALMKRHSGLSRIDSGGADASQNDIIDKIIEKLKEKKFINDEEFARGWVESRLRFKPRSAQLIKLELKRKGIDPETISKMINDAPLRQGFEGQEGLVINDLESAKKLVEKRIGRLKDLPEQKIYEKLGRYLASKGFGWDTIKKSIDPVKS